MEPVESMISLKYASRPFTYFWFRNSTGWPPDCWIRRCALGSATAPWSMVMKTYGLSVGIRLITGTEPSVTGGAFCWTTPKGYGGVNAGGVRDGGVRDAGVRDAGVRDAGVRDAGG